jgi:hypothetical protein
VEHTRFLGKRVSKAGIQKHALKNLVILFLENPQKLLVLQGPPSTLININLLEPENQLLFDM